MCPTTIKWVWLKSCDPFQILGVNWASCLGWLQVTGPKCHWSKGLLVLRVAGSNDVMQYSTDPSDFWTCDPLEWTSDLSDFRTSDSSDQWTVSILIKGLPVLEANCWGKLALGFYRLDMIPFQSCHPSSSIRTLKWSNALHLRQSVVWPCSFCIHCQIIDRRKGHCSFQLALSSHLSHWLCNFIFLVPDAVEK